MARARRRSVRAQAREKSEPQYSPLSSPTPIKSDSEDKLPAQSEAEKCPACEDDASIELNDAEKENWVRCDACKKWYHWRCAGDGGDLELIDKWFCGSCLIADPSRNVTLKPPARKSSRKRTQRDYANLDSGLESDAHKWTRILQGKVIKEDRFKRVKGSDLTLEWLDNDETAMREPIVIEKPDGLGMKMPPRNFSVSDVAEAVGEDTSVEVIDVASQSNCPGWTLGKWAEYYNTEPSARDKIRNVISLEISDTPLADQVLPPRIVRELDWVEKYWPSTRRGRGHAYPKVQLYCLMGVQSAWTDWHIDFAGSSVYYHVLHGSKVFYFIRPTPAALAAYERWSGTEIQNHQWLGDMVDEVVKVTLHEGNTMIIPTGWIHAVHTPVDSLVFGGNFLHSYNVATQLKVCDIEKSTNVPKKFRFPMFSRLCWYVGEKVLRDLKAKEEFSQRVLESIEVLAGYLVSQARMIERGSEHAKREVKDQVPSDRVKDPSALARELRWRVRLAIGCGTDDEEHGRRKRSSAASVNSHETTNKRRRMDHDSQATTGIFKNFRPKQWETVVEKDGGVCSRVTRYPKPEVREAWESPWLEWKDDVQGSNDGDGGEVQVHTRRELVVKVRRTKNGLERQRVERVVEEWAWDDGSIPPKLEGGDYETDKVSKNGDDMVLHDTAGEDSKLAVDV